MIDPSSYRFRTLTSSITAGTPITLTADGAAVPAPAGAVAVGHSATNGAGGSLLAKLREVPRTIEAPAAVAAGKWLYVAEGGGLALVGAHRCFFTLEPARAAGERIKALPAGNHLYSESLDRHAGPSGSGAARSAIHSQQGEPDMATPTTHGIYREAFDGAVAVEMQQGKSLPSAKRHVIRNRPDLVHCLNSTARQNAAAATQQILTDRFKRTSK